MKKSSAITFVQIVAALAIVNVHTIDLEIPYLSRIAKLGFVFNLIFVLLSGYFIAYKRSHSYAQKLGEFFHRRVSRMYPSLHVAVLLIAAIYWLIHRQFSLRSFLLTLTGFQYFFKDDQFGPQLWFLGMILICYGLFPATDYCMRRWPKRALGTIVGSFLLAVWYGDGTFYGVYNQISSVAVYRVLYHYAIFAVGVALGRYGLDLEQHFRQIRYLCLLSVSFPLYLWSYNKPEWGSLAILAAFGTAIGTFSLLLRLYPWAMRWLSGILLLAPITYELYLSHYAVIYALDSRYHGWYIAYPLTFLLSIGLAFVVLHLSKLYSQFLSQVRLRLGMLLYGRSLG